MSELAMDNYTAGNLTMESADALVDTLLRAGVDVTGCLHLLTESSLMRLRECVSSRTAAATGDWLALTNNLNAFFLVINAIIIYLMQGGFALLECGAIRAKNATNILTKNLLDSFIAAVSYWLIGWALAFGKGNPFCGTHFWALSGASDGDYPLWFFHFAFAATAATIVSGAVAERCEFMAYVAYSILITGVMYPIVTHWAWSEYGWLNRGVEFEDNEQTSTASFQDFAGSGVVHLLGGTVGLVAAIFLGPRIGRFDDDGKPHDIPGHSMPLTALGGFIIFFGFFAFNGGSEANITAAGAGVNVSRAVVNTIISASFAGLTCLVTWYLQLMLTGEHAIFSLCTSINGAITGMVAICAGCNAVYPWAAALTGTVAGWVYLLASFLAVKCRIDDPLDAVAVHGGGGLWGLVAVPFLRANTGIVYRGDKASFMCLGMNLLGALSIILWSGGLSALLFGGLKAAGRLRVSWEVETRGIDVPKHGEPAYPVDAYEDGWQTATRTLLVSCQNTVPAVANNGKSSHI